jgi:TonB family protein
VAALPPAIDFDTIPPEGNVIDITADPTNERTISPEESIIRQQIFANSDIEITANPRDVINGKVNYTPEIRGENDAPLAFQPNASLVAKLQKDTQNTSDEDARKNYVAWAKEVQNVAPQQLTLSGIYPKDACVGKLEGTAAYGVTVDSAGSVVNTQLIKSSGYPLFNDQALRQIRSHGFANDTGANKPYHVYVNYNYNAQICPSLSISNVGNTSSGNSNTVDTPQNSIEPNQSNTSKPPATFSIPKTESNPPKSEVNNVTPPKTEVNINSNPVQPKPTPAAEISPEKTPETTPVVPSAPPTLPELKPLIENQAPSSQKTLEIETSPSPTTQE